LEYECVPFVYSLQSVYILKYTKETTFSNLYYFILFSSLFIAYYIWDTSQSQRNRFRMKLNNTYIPRNTFPQLPWGTLSQPKFLNTAAGSKLLIDGWWRYARKIHYTCDIYMALSWGLSCGFNSFVPYFYFSFFTGMIIHRANRDIAKCSEKYGKDWDKYCNIVPYQFIPFIY